MPFFDDLRKIEKPKPFEGGQKSQREHLNKVQGALKEVLDAADRHVEEAAALEDPETAVEIDVYGVVKVAWVRMRIEE